MRVWLCTQEEIPSYETQKEPRSASQCACPACGPRNYPDGSLSVMREVFTSYLFITLFSSYTTSNEYTMVEIMFTRSTVFN